MGWVTPSDPAVLKRMRRQKTRDTSPELRVRRVLHSLGLRYRVHDRSLPGSPDVANRSRRWVVFVHGCFWHGHDCKPRAFRGPNAAVWEEKLERNRERDRRSARELRRLGYKVVVVWECRTKDLARLRARLRRALVNGGRRT